MGIEWVEQEVALELQGLHWHATLVGGGGWCLWQLWVLRSIVIVANVSIIKINNWVVLMHKYGWMFLIPSKSQIMPLVGVKKKKIWSHSNKPLEIHACYNKLEYIILIVCINSSYSHKPAHTVVVIRKQLACCSDPPIGSRPIECKSLTLLKCPAHDHSKIHWKWGGSPQHLFQPGEQHAGDFSGYRANINISIWCTVVCI